MFCPMRAFGLKPIWDSSIVPHSSSPKSRMKAASMIFLSAFVIAIGLVLLIGGLLFSVLDKSRKFASLIHGGGLDEPFTQSSIHLMNEMAFLLFLNHLSLMLSGPRALSVEMALSRSGRYLDLSVNLQ